MTRFLIGINGDFEDECRSMMIYDNMDLSRLLVHVQQVYDSKNKRGVRDTRSPKPHDKDGPKNGGNMNSFGVREQP